MFRMLKRIVENIDRCMTERSCAPVLCFIRKFAFRAIGVVLRIVDNSETLRKRKADCAQGAGATKTLGSRRSLARRSAVMVTVSRLQTMRSCKLSTAASDT